jgi:hypothetical protein
MLLNRAWAQARRGNAFPLIMGGYAVVLVLMGSTAQPTALGFLVLGAGLMLAACNPTKAEMLKRRASMQAAREKLGASTVMRGAAPTP